MNQSNNSLLNAFTLACLFFSPHLYAHGFAENTLVKKSHYWWRIKQILENPQHEKIYVLSYNLDTEQVTTQRVRTAGRGTTNCYCEVTITDGTEQFDEVIKCTPTQEFFVPHAGEWVPAFKLKFGDMLLSTEEVPRWVRNVTLHKQSLNVYSIEIENSHSFFVGKHAVLTHNTVLPVVLAAGLSIPFGAGAVAGGATGCFLGPVALVGGFIFGGLGGLLVGKALLNSDKAPGTPAEDDGFVPPKKWDGKKVRHPKNGRVGWPDKDGNIWVPTGPKGHGGPHWDVQYPNGRYDNVYPGNKIRPGK